jgi:uncharacterized membrane protein (UPF0127 family)
LADLKVRFVASDDASRQRGLMYASPLADDEVAFFVFPQSERYGFWNRNVTFPISLAFVGEGGEIVDIRHLDAHQESPVRPDSPARFVVEAAKGAFDRLGVRIGDLAICDGKTLKVVTSGRTKGNLGLNGAWGLGDIR